MALKEQGTSFNQTLYSRRDFHNPNISDLLLSYSGLDEHGTNFRDEVYPEDEGYDYAAVSNEQRAVWERAQAPAVKPPAAAMSRDSVPQSITATKTEYAAIMQERFRSSRQQ